MTMNFEVLQSNIVSILGAAAAGRFRVIGYQSTIEDAEEYLGLNRLVRVYYSEGRFPKEKGSITGGMQHEATYVFELVVTEGAKGDLAVIDNPASTPSEIQTALAGMKYAEDLADRSWDELAGIVYQIIMDARNRDMGMPLGAIADRWLDNPQKDQPGEIGVQRGIRGGKWVTITGTMRMTCVLDEEILGDEGTLANIYDNVIDIDNDDNEKTGVLQDNTPIP